MTEVDPIRALQARYLNTMSGEEARRLDGEIQRRLAALGTTANPQPKKGKTK